MCLLKVEQISQIKMWLQRHALKNLFPHISIQDKLNIIRWQRGSLLSSCKKITSQSKKNGHKILLSFITNIVAKFIC